MKLAFFPPCMYLKGKNIVATVIMWYHGLDSY